MTELKKINEFLESELVCLIEVQKECIKAKHSQSLLDSQCESLMNDLEKERDVIRVWTNSGKTTHKVLYDNKWKKQLGYSEEISEEKENVKTENAKQKKVFKAKRPLSIPVKFSNYEPAFKFKMNKIKYLIQLNQKSNLQKSQSLSLTNLILLLLKLKQKFTK